MRLQQIRLSGFKTFVDPSVIDLPTNRTALVGPNGAGKSNVIDAVRWVIGERSAKNLRGQVLEDVIFKGSDTRAPTDLASIELIFDEVSGQVGRLSQAGSELSVRREISRDGQSVFRLNGTRCRRRDVLDVFLDTGFTAQGYAIIEQGQISDLVQAKPDELRGYLEEAAGISRYKERRRETELSMEQTRLNLERAGDLRHEREERINNLQRQAKRAERYRKLVEKQRDLEACEVYSRRQLATSELAKIEEKVASIEAVVADCETKRAAQESKRDTLFVKRDAASAKVNQENGAYYDAGAELSRIESDISALVSSREQHAQDIDAAKAERDALQTSVAEGRERLAVAKLSLVKHRNVISEAKSERDRHRAALEAFETRLQAERGKLDAATSEASNLQREVALVEAEIRSTRERIADGEQRLGHLATRNDVSESQDAETMQAIEDEHAHAERARAKLFDDKQETLSQRAELRAKVAPLEADIETKRAKEQSLRRELIAIQALVGEAGEEDAEAIDNWLETQGAKHLSRVGGRAQPQPGWEAAARTLLSGKTAGVLVPNLVDLTRHLTRLSAGELLIVQAPTSEEREASSLEEIIGMSLGSLFAGVRVASNIAEALELRSGLASGESVICPEGVWLGKDWARINRRHLPESAFDAAPDVEELKFECKQASEAVDSARGLLCNVREALEQTQSKLDEIERDIDLAQAASASVMAKREIEQARQKEVRRRFEENARAREKLDQLRLHLDGRLPILDALVKRSDAERQAREALQSHVQGLERQRSDLRQATSESEANFSNARIEQERLAAAELTLSQSLPEMTERLKRLDARIAEFEERLSAASQNTPKLEIEREHCLAKRLEIEQSLQRARRELESVDTEIRQAAQTLRGTESELESLREQREDTRVSAGAARAQVAELEARFNRLDTSLDEVPGMLTSFEDQSVEALEGKRLEAERAMERIGEVNLAAASDLEREREQYEALQAQIEDLETSLVTLSDALEKIDSDMVQRFRSTFDLANAGLAELFPKLFRGGSARLEMHGERLLETGVTFMANPPGKRNTSVALLSGGEKAMSAIALVFSLFRLNPSPVCLLDEVDAPLDDENVKRFVELIRDMSGEVQFVIITHNKLTMEMADHLVGVTMREPGVSRLVSVDVTEAVSLAAS